MITIVKIECPACKGRGNYRQILNTKSGLSTVLTCERCNGSGKVAPEMVEEAREDRL